MKKVFLVILGGVVLQTFAQELGSVSTSAFGNSRLGLGIIGILAGGFFYVALPLFLYCISSYSLGLLNKQYSGASSSRISWVPFVRYYDFVKKAIKSSKKAFFITLLPWILLVGGIVGAISVGLIEKNISTGDNGWSTPAFITFGFLILSGALSVVVMNFWRAFIISKYVKGDTTTALGLSTYTALVLWYIALDRVRKNTNIIGILGFVVLGLIICFYVAIAIMLGFSGIATFLSNQ